MPRLLLLLETPAKYAPVGRTARRAEDQADRLRATLPRGTLRSMDTTHHTPSPSPAVVDRERQRIAALLDEWRRDPANPDARESVRLIIGNLPNLPRATVEGIAEAVLTDWAIIHGLGD